MSWRQQISQYFFHFPKTDMGAFATSNNLIDWYVSESTLNMLLFFSDPILLLLFDSFKKWRKWLLFGNAVAYFLVQTHIFLSDKVYHFAWLS